MKLKSVTVSFIALLTLFSCGEKPDSPKFFSAGEKVKSGLIWKQQDVGMEKILENKRISLVFEEKFDKLDPKLWTTQGGDWKVAGGEARTTNALNRNMVLSGFDLPDNCVVEMDILSRTDYVDAKFNLFGDGKIHDHGDGYTFIMGGWKGKISVISKLHEHERGRVENRSASWESERLYKVKVVKIEGRIYWYVDNKLFLAYLDKKPLKTSEGFKHLSLANWKSDLSFDNLRIFKIED